MNVLSLFDGMSCGRIALDRANIPVTNYYASELDKYAIKVSQANYPDIIQLGDVETWFLWNIDWSNIDFLIGGSPCQGFSFAGKQLAFDDPRSKLFFVYVDILKYINKKRSEVGKSPVKFLLENVKMKKEYLAVISEHLGVEPVFINSALVSAQNRQRYYWCNWEVSQPEDKTLCLADILENNVSKKYYMSDSWHIWWNKNCDFQLKKKYSSLDGDNAITMTARQYASWNGNFIHRLGHYNKGSQADRIYSVYGKSVTLSALGGGGGAKTGLYKDHDKIRKLTPIECERLQTLPDNYTNHVSNTQRYKMLGNGWTVDVIAHIFRTMK